MRRLALPPGRWSWLVPLLSLGAAAALTAFVAIALLGGDDDAPASAEGPATLERVVLRSAPAATAAALATLEAGRQLRIDGRSQDGSWVAVVALDGELAGWLPVGAIGGLPDLGGLAVEQVPAPPAATPTAAAQPVREVTPTLTPDYPDLIVSEVYARDNRLVVVVANEGSADAEGPIEVSVDGGPAHRIDVGNPLRPGDRLEQMLSGEYVQRRAQVVVTVRAATRVNEENAGNNIFAGIVAPDAPNDLELLDISYGGADPHLIVTVHNHSPIPLRGVITIGVRQTSPQDQLLLRDERALDIGADETQSFDFFEFSGIPLEFVRVIVSSDAINDADSANNTLPR